MGSPATVPEIKRNIELDARLQEVHVLAAQRPSPSNRIYASEKKWYASSNFDTGKPYS